MSDKKNLDLQKQRKFKFSVEKMYKLFLISTSGYYLWLKGASFKRSFLNKKLNILIQYPFKDSFESYGAPRIKTDLKKFDYCVSIPKELWVYM